MKDINENDYEMFKKLNEEVKTIKDQRYYIASYQSAETGFIYTRGNILSNADCLLIKREEDRNYVPHNLIKKD